jgi:hypothetical protein
LFKLKILYSQRLSKPKFFLLSLYFINAILEKYFIQLGLSRYHRNMRKLNLSMKDLIFCMKYTLRLQRKAAVGLRINTRKFGGISRRTIGRAQIFYLQRMLLSYFG